MLYYYAVSYRPSLLSLCSFLEPYHGLLMGSGSFTYIPFANKGAGPLDKMSTMYLYYSVTPPTAFRLQASVSLFIHLF